MTNFEKWRYIYKDVVSPQSYIDFAFYYLIGACLQRRVWLNDESHMPLYPNPYIVLVGGPGIGKGVMIKQVASFLRHHKKTMTAPAPKEVDEDKITEVTPESLMAQMMEVYGETVGKVRSDSIKETPLLFPVAPDSTTFESLVYNMAKSSRSIQFKVPAEDGKLKTKIYFHCSMAFCLEEVSSLFRKHTEDTVNFMMVAYDCGDYVRKTKTQGDDFVKRCCLSFFGATQPSFLQRTFNDALLNEGFASRTIFVFEFTNRFYKFNPEELNIKQRAYKQDILDHIRKLSQLYGRVHYTPAAARFFKNWWEHEHDKIVVNPHPKLQYYYERKNLHVQKIALALHFGEHAEADISSRPLAPISVETCHRALQVLSEIEVNMHHALTFEGRNPLAATAKKVLAFMRQHSKPLNIEELLVEFYDDANEGEIKDIVNYLLKTKKIAGERGGYVVR